MLVRSAGVVFVSSRLVNMVDSLQVDRVKRQSLARGDIRREHKGPECDEGYCPLNEGRCA